MGNVVRAVARPLKKIVDWAFGSVNTSKPPIQSQTATKDNYPMPKFRGFTTRNINIAIIGDSGNGKSSFINTFLQKKQNDPTRAKVSVVECTGIQTGIHYYQYLASNNRVLFWDLPGCGTKKYPFNTYVKRMGLRHFDLCIIISSNRFTEHDDNLAIQLKSFNVPIYLIRSKFDQDLMNHCHENMINFYSLNKNKQNNLIKNLMFTMKNDMMRTLTKSKNILRNSFYILSSHHIDLTMNEWSKLNERITFDLMHHRNTDDSLKNKLRNKWKDFKNFKFSNNSSQNSKRFWICKFCTFQNTNMLTDCCEICNKKNVLPDVGEHGSQNNYSTMGKIQEFWKCHKCTFHNEDMFANKCKLCETKKRSVIIKEENKNDEKSEDSNDYQSFNNKHKYSKQLPSNKWTCKFCTFENNKHMIRCEMCLQNKDTSPPIIKPSIEHNKSINLTQNHSNEFEYWLTNIVKKEEYLQAFKKNNANDIRFVQDFEISHLESFGITNRLHLKLFEREIYRFILDIKSFKKWLKKNDLIEFDNYLNSIGILTLKSFDRLLRKIKNNPSILIDENVSNNGIPKNVLRVIYEILSIDTMYFNSTKYI